MSDWGTCDYWGCEDLAQWVVEPGVYLCQRHGVSRRPDVACVHCRAPINGVDDTRGDHKPTCPRYEGATT